MIAVRAEQLRARQRVVYLVAAVFALFASASARATQYWELSPTTDPRAAFGTYTVVSGKTSPGGVNFTLKNNAIEKPVQLTLVSTRTGVALHLSAFKSDAPFFGKDTDQTGMLVVRFRTGEDISFQVTGPTGSTYQMAVWRGPVIRLATGDPIVAMDAAQAGGVVPLRAAPDVTPASHAPEPKESSTLIYVLLAGIFAALVVIAGLIFRGQQMRGKS